MPDEGCRRNNRHRNEQSTWSLDEAEYFHCNRIKVYYRWVSFMLVAVTASSLAYASIYRPWIHADDPKTALMDAQFKLLQSISDFVGIKDENGLREQFDCPDLLDRKSTRLNSS